MLVPASSTMFATMGTGKFFGLGAGGAFASHVVYQRAAAEGKKGSDTLRAFDGSRGRLRAAEKSRLEAEKRVREEGVRHVMSHHVTNDASPGVSSVKPKVEAPKDTNVTKTIADIARVTKTNKSIDASKALKAESTVTDKAVDETVVTTDVNMQGDMRPSESKPSSPMARSVRRTRGASRAAAAETSEIFTSNKNAINTITAVSVPFALAIGRGLFKTLLGRQRSNKNTHSNAISGTASPNLDKVRAFVAELKKSAGGKSAALEIGKLLKERDALEASVKAARGKSFEKENPLHAAFPSLSLRSKAAVAKFNGGSCSMGKQSESGIQDLDKVIGFQAKELRFLRLALAEKDLKIQRLTEQSSLCMTAPFNALRDDALIVKSMPFKAAEKVTKWDSESDSDVSSVASDDDAIDATINLTVDETVDEVMAELAQERKRNAEVYYERGEEIKRNQENKENQRVIRGKTELDRRMFDTPVAKKFIDNNERIERGKSRVLRISPTRRQRERNLTNSLMMMR